MANDPAAPKLPALNLDRLGLRQYAKVVKGGITAVLTSVALLGLGKLGVDVGQEIIDLGPESQEITWRQSINAIAPLVAVVLTSNGPVEPEVDDADLAAVPDYTNKVDDPDGTAVGD